MRSKENAETRMEDEFPHIIFIKDVVPSFDIFITLFLISTAITLIGIKLKKNKEVKVIG